MFRKWNVENKSSTNCLLRKVIKSEVVIGWRRVNSIEFQRLKVCISVGIIRQNNCFFLLYIRCDSFLNVDNYICKEMMQQQLSQWKDARDFQIKNWRFLKRGGFFFRLLLRLLLTGDFFSPPFLISFVVLCWISNFIFDKFIDFYFHTYLLAVHSPPFSAWRRLVQSLANTCIYSNPFLRCSSSSREIYFLLLLLLLALCPSSCYPSPTPEEFCIFMSTIILIDNWNLWRDCIGNNKLDGNDDELTIRKFNIFFSPHPFFFFFRGVEVG